MIKLTIENTDKKYKNKKHVITLDEIEIKIINHFTMQPVERLAKEGIIKLVPVNTGGFDLCISGVKKVNEM